MRSAYNQSRRNKYATDPEYRSDIISRSRSGYATVRRKLLAAYGAKCQCCGETEPMFLELDHVNGGGAKHYKAVNTVTIYRQILKDGCPPDYRLLCANCNKGRSRNGGVCPHIRAL